MSLNVLTRAAADSGSNVQPETACGLTAGEVRALTEIGFLAATTGHHQSAETIFSGLEQIRPGRLSARFGFAVAWIYAGRASDAVVLLEQLTCGTEDERATRDAWLGMALQLSGHAGRGRQVLAAAAQAGGTGGALARGLLGKAKP